MKPTLVVLAAGMGSRYGGIKQIDAVGQHNETLLDFATFDAKRSGFEKVVYIIRKDIEKDFRERLFDRVAKNFDAEYVFQSPEAIFTSEQLAQKNPDRTKPWGTIHAVLCAEKVLSSPFAVINADDYYGKSAFEIMANHLSSQSETSTEHAMVGFILENTMSKVGSVSRGICCSENDFLVSMEEHTKISFEGDKIVSLVTDEVGNDKKIYLTGKETVSMNFFGFNMNAFKTFHEYWDDFVAKNISSLKAEAYLPEAASRIVKNNAGSIKVYPSEEKWFGMTYPEDREIVKSEIANKITTGYYPEKLWD
ncbi:MAG: hypothetical protein IIX47_02985 [Spirochaetaceae bacterium]|nr:hypothetical protein [Spirochaetaceae bacterium]